MFEERFELLRPIRPGNAFVSLLAVTIFLVTIFLITSSSVISRFSDQLLLLRKRFLRKKVIGKRIFLTHNIDFMVVIGKNVFRSLLF